MNRTLLITMGLLSFLFGSCSKQPSQLTTIDHTVDKPIGRVNTTPTQPTASNPHASKFRAGQVWAFKTPPNQPNAKLTVLRVEDGGKVGTVVHIALSGVSFGDGQTAIPHLPFAESAVEQCVTTLERESGPVPDFAEGYRLWREAFDAGKGGVFSITVADVFETVIGALRNRK
jgi:guanyl-specific ribonuclease Sa